MSAIISKPLRKRMEARADEVTREKTKSTVRRMYLLHSKRVAQKRGVAMDEKMTSRAEAAANSAFAL